MDGQSRLLFEIGKKRIGAVQGFALAQRFLPGRFALGFLVGRDFTRRDFALGDFEEGFAELNLRLGLGVVVFHGCISKYSNSPAKEGVLQVASTSSTAGACESKIDAECKSTTALYKHWTAANGD